tara:strand:+ start:4566 stop:4871 length:306 start_codon:yes stop_codon:yes gene_type:complete
MNDVDQDSLHLYEQFKRFNIPTCTIGKNKKRARKLAALKKFKDLKIEQYYGGLVIINDKYIVSLMNNKWRVVNKNIWYRHKEDIDHFVNKYILGENNETNN